ncbi:MAG: CBS domain-containing protein [Bacteroidota bacterium]
MIDEILDEEFSIMYTEGSQVKTLDSSTFKKPIRNIRVKRPLTLSPDKTVAEAVEMMQKNRVGCLLVVEKEKMVGIFTERDVLLKVAGKKGVESMKLREVMTPKVEGFEPDDSVAYVLNAMHVGGYRHVPVVDEKGKPVAVISIKDIVGFLIEHFSEDILNLPPAPMRKTEQREGA